MRTTGQNQEDEPTFHETVDVPFLQSRVDRAKKVMETMKAKRMTQKGFNTLIVLDDLADIKRGLPAVAKLVDGLFVKARHWGISLVLCTKKLKLPLISQTVRVICTFIMAWRLRAWHDLWDGLIQEYSALVSKEQLYEMYKEAVAVPYGFLYVNMLSQDVNEMFYSGFTHRFQVTEE